MLKIINYSIDLKIVENKFFRQNISGNSFFIYIKSVI